MRRRIDYIECAVSQGPLCALRTKIAAFARRKEPAACELVHSGYRPRDGGGIRRQHRKGYSGPSWTMTNYYKRAVYRAKDSKIGDIDDVLVAKSGKIIELIVGVGGFLSRRK
jgi:hypothetical protein